MDNNLKDLSKKEVEAIKKVMDYKRIAESNIVSILWKNQDLYTMYDSLKLDQFTHNEWKVYFQIGYDLIIKEHKETLDDITVGLYLEKHDKLRDKYDEYGGFDTISKASEYVDEKNIQSYINDLNKWNVIIKMAKSNFPIANRLSDYVDMTVDEIYDEKEAILNHIFSGVEGEDETFRLSDGMEELVDKLDSGDAVGLEYYNSPLLSEETGGACMGNITLVGALSGVGKSTFVRNTHLISLLQSKEDVVIMVNEEGITKWQREMMIFVANNVFNKNLQKYTLRNGKFTDELKEFLKKEVIPYIRNNDEGIIIKQFKRYNTSTAIKHIKKYAHMGVKYFCLDTFKVDADCTEAERENMKNNMTALYDTIKDSNLNVHLLCTFQLSKGSSKQRFYTQDNIGESKCIVDVASTCLMIRNMFEDEMPNGKRELKVFKLVGKNKKTRVPVKLDENKHYQIIFIIKNREGSSNEYQIVVECDLSRNTYKEVGLTVVSCDF